MNKFDVKLLSNGKNFIKLTFKPTFRREKQLDCALIMIQKDECRISLNKPTHIGASILELSKIIWCQS